MEQKYWGYRILKQIGLRPKKEDFESLYIGTIYNLIHEHGKEKKIIRLFELSEVKNAFKVELYEKNNWSFQLAFDDHLHTNPAFRNLKDIRIDIDRELRDFRNEFIKLINESRSPKEVESQQNISSIMQGMDTLKAGVDDIKEKLGGLEIEEIKFPKSEVAPLVYHLSKRAKVVDALLSLFEKKETIYLTGSISTGKTQLSALIFDQHAGEKYWVDLKDTDSNNFFEKIVQMLGELARENGKARNSTQPWLFVVLDDLPRLDKTSPYLTAFARFILSSKKKNMKLLITSNFNLPSQIRDVIPDARIGLMNIPFLTEEETVEVLKSYGASDANCDEFKSIVHVVSHGHPTIASAICKFLRSVKWTVNSDELTRLFKDDYSLDLTEETYSDVVNTVEDSGTRELLYRLNIIKSSFTTTQVSLVAEIDPQIDSPLEKLNSIIGLWVQRASDERYELSPLIERLKSDNLNSIVIRKINFNLGVQILARKKLNQFEARQAIRYFLASGAVDQAAFVLIIALNDALKTPEIFFDWGFNLYWTYEGLPTEMDVRTKIFIRILHLMLYIKREDKYSDRLIFVRNDLEKILLSADPATDNYAYASLFLSTLYSKENSSKSLKYFALGVQYFDRDGSGDLRKEIEKQYSPEHLIWTSTRAIKTEQEVDEWFSAFAALSPERQAKALELHEVRMGATFITENLIKEEERKQTAEQDWNKLLVVFEKIKTRSEELNIKLLLARALKGIIYITSAKLNNIESAKQIGDNALQVFPAEERAARFLISDILGRELFYKGKRDEAEKYIAEAIAMEVDDFYTDKLDTFLVMSQLLGDKDKVSAHHYIEKALEFVQDEFVFTDTQRVKVRAEFAISLSLLNRIDDAIYQMEIGYDTIFSRGIGLPDYKILTLRYMHVINYWHSIHHKKKQPDDIDNEPYQAPYRGYFFMGYTDEYVEKNWMDERPFIGTHALLSCFEYLGDIAMAKKWALSSVAINKAMTSNAFGSIVQLSVPYFVLDDKYDEAIECQISVLKQYNAIGDALKNITNERLKKAFQDAPMPRTTVVEYDWHVISAVIIPTTLRLLRLRIEGNPDALRLLRSAIAAAERWKAIFTYQDSIEKIIEMLRDLENERIDGQALATSLQTYNGSSGDSVKTVGYLIASTLTATPQSFYLHAALIKTTEETMKRISGGSYKFLLVPFLEEFWFDRVKARPEDFQELGFWTEKSLPYYNQTDEKKKIKMLFRILSNHVKGIIVSNELESWIDE
jgi:hypothetical protein